jgi:hypothetical protein
MVDLPTSEHLFPPYGQIKSLHLFLIFKYEEEEDSALLLLLPALFAE